LLLQHADTGFAVPRSQIVFVEQPQQAGNQTTHCSVSDIHANLECLQFPLDLAEVGLKIF
jgi:hypothetical protein